MNISIWLVSDNFISLLISWTWINKPKIQPNMFPFASFLFIPAPCILAPNATTPLHCEPLCRSLFFSELWTRALSLDPIYPGHDNKCLYKVQEVYCGNLRPELNLINLKLSDNQSMIARLNYLSFFNAKYQLVQ